jgi:hypothetical protein
MWDEVEERLVGADRDIRFPWSALLEAQRGGCGGDGAELVDRDVRGVHGIFQGDALGDAVKTGDTEQSGDVELTLDEGPQRSLALSKRGRYSSSSCISGTVTVEPSSFVKGAGSVGYLPNGRAQSALR